MTHHNFDPEVRGAAQQIAKELNADSDLIFGRAFFPALAPMAIALMLAKEIAILLEEQDYDRGRLAMMVKTMEHYPGSAEADRLELRRELREEKARANALEAQLRAELVEALREVAKLTAQIEARDTSHGDA